MTEGINGTNQRVLLLGKGQTAMETCCTEGLLGPGKELLEMGGGEGRGPWGSQVSVPKTARPDIPCCKFRCVPLWSLGPLGGGGPRGVPTLLLRRTAILVLPLGGGVGRMFRGHTPPPPGMYEKEGGGGVEGGGGAGFGWDPPPPWVPLWSPPKAGRKILSFNPLGTKGNLWLSASNIGRGGGKGGPGGGYPPPSSYGVRPF